MRSREAEMSHDKPKQGLSADKKMRARQVSDGVAVREAVNAIYDLSDADWRRMGDYTPGDEVSDYGGRPDIQADIITRERERAAAQAIVAESDMRTAALRAHLPAAAILGIEKPEQAAMMPPVGHMYD